jgi:hypothetical protein
LGNPLFQEGEITNRLICGLVQFEQDSSHPILDALPEIVHFPRLKSDDPIWATTTLIDAEMQRMQGQGGPIIDRLTEVLFLQLLNYHVNENKEAAGFLAALRDRRVTQTSTYGRSDAWESLILRARVRLQEDKSHRWPGTPIMRPHLWISEEKQVKALWLLFFAFLAVGGILGQFAPPGGWLTLEFPAFADLSLENSPASWERGERDAALFGLGLDFLFLIIYPLFLSLLCGRAGRDWKLPKWLARMSLFFSGLVLLAAPLDVIENFGLYFLIRGNTSETLQWMITTVAAFKWSIALAAGLLGLCCIAAMAWRGRTPS